MPRLMLVPDVALLCVEESLDVLMASRPVFMGFHNIFFLRGLGTGRGQVLALGLEASI